MTNHEVITRATAALAESVDTIVDVDKEQAAALAQTFEEFRDYMTKNTADRDDGGSGQRFSQMFSSPKQAERALACIIAARSRLRKSESETKEELEAERLAHLRAVSPVGIAKVLVAENSARGISEHEFTQLVTEFAKRENPELTDAQAFSKVFSAPTEDGEIIRAAFEVIKAAQVASLDLYPMPR
jgi:hypothetical protein